MDIISEPLAVEQSKGPFVPKAQPVQAMTNLEPMLDDNAVRQALMNAEANNQDPMTVTMADLDAVQKTQEQPAKVQPSQPIPADIPEKFLKPDGAVDVEKLQASTRQLDEAIQKKEEVIKTVDDLWGHYKDSQKKFGAMPNVERLQAQLPPQPQEAFNPQTMPDQQLRALIAQDYANDPVATTAKLIEIAIEKRFQPLEEKEKDSAVRENIQKLAEKDPRVLQYYNAVTSTLNKDPEYWKLKNPHRAAWLDVKEELRLGEPSTVQAQPSKSLSPVLGGGAPPSTPSSSVPQTQNILGNLDKIDLRDRKQEALADEAVRAFLAQNR